jgi:hypothetical protein
VIQTSLMAEQVMPTRLLKAAFDGGSVSFLGNAE